MATRKPITKKRGAKLTPPKSKPQPVRAKSKSQPAPRRTRLTAKKAIGKPGQASPLAIIKGIPVFQDANGRVHWQSGGAIDADGSNGQNGNKFAYRKDDHGLDYNRNAGWPNGGWRNVLVDNGQGQPIDDGKGNWYSQTTYTWKGRSLGTRYVDATAVPYLVVNPIVRRKAKGVVIGCKARATYKGVSVNAVVADVSGGADIGELSIAAGEILKFENSSPRDGGVADGVLFEFWPDVAAVVNKEKYELQRM